MRQLGGTGEGMIAKVVNGLICIKHESTKMKEEEREGGIPTENP